MTEHQHVPDGPYGRADGLEYCGVGERSAASTERVVRAPKRPAARGTGHDARVLAPPSIVKRNTLLLAASQAFVGVGNQMVPTLGAIIVARLLGSAHLAGMATSALRVSRFLVSYPIGRVADLYGRRVAVVLGLLLGLAGAVSIGLSVLLGSFALFLAGILVFGAGVSAGYQLRVAAADMYPPSQRAQGLGYVLTGSLVGALGGPVLITAAQAWSDTLGLDPLALTWILVPLVIVPGIGLVLAVHPDPKEIAANLERYYPGYCPPRAGGTNGTAATDVHQRHDECRRHHRLAIARWPRRRAFRPAGARNTRSGPHGPRLHARPDAIERDIRISSRGTVNRREHRPFRALAIAATPMRTRLGLQWVAQHRP
jgi:hypothetical protein